MSYSLPGSPIDLSATRRAFPLDSRTVWVEQQIVMNGIVSRDNLYVGPMDYNPKIPEKHIPTPTIARPKTVDTFHPYKGNCGGTVGLSKRGSGKLKTKKKKSQYMEPLGDIRGTFGDSRSEYATPFSDHDKRMPIDPSRRYYITDTPSLPIDPFLHSRYHCDGARGPAKVGGLICQDRTERMRAKPAMPQSDSVYNTDTPLVNKRPVGGKIFPEAVSRNGPKKYGTSTTEKDTGTKKETDVKAKLTGTAAKEVERPPLRLRKQPVLEFDASCYKLNKKEGGVNMTPALSKNRAKVNVFQSMITTKINYKSKPIESPLAERVRRNFM